MRKIEVKVRQFIWAIKTSLKPTTYDLVEYKGDTFFIKSSLTGEGVWNLFKVGETSATYFYIKNRDLKLLHSFKRFVKVIKWHLHFQETSWGRIDRNKPIGRRLCYYSSENILF